MKKMLRAFISDKNDINELSIAGLVGVVLFVIAFVLDNLVVGVSIKELWVTHLVNIILVCFGAAGGVKIGGKFLNKNNG